MNLHHHNYLKEKRYFEKIPTEARKKWIQKMARTSQIPSEVPKIYIQSHQQSTNPFQYKQWTLNYHKVQTCPNPPAVVFWFHGLNCHGGNYGYISNNLAKSLKINVYLLDMMGFGQSEGKQRGLVSSWEESLDQAEKFIGFILSKFQQRPKVFLGGDSFGGAICFHLTIQRPNFYSGVIFTAPGLRDLPNLFIPKLLTKIVGYFIPDLKLIQSRYDMVTKYDCTRHIVADKLNYLGRLMPGTYRVALSVSQKTPKLFKEFKAPYILFQGGVDKIVDPFAPIDLQRECQSTDKKTVYFRNMWHSIVYEQEIVIIVKMMIEWLKQRI